MGQNGKLPAGGRLLGAPQQVAIIEQQVVPLLYIELVNQVGGVATEETCMRIVNPLSGLAVFCPISPQGAATLAGMFQRYADSHVDRGGADGSATVHE